MAQDDNNATWWRSMRWITVSWYAVCGAVLRLAHRHVQVEAVVRVRLPLAAIIPWQQVDLPVRYRRNVRWRVVGEHAGRVGTLADAAIRPISAVHQVAVLVVATARAGTRRTVNIPALPVENLKKPVQFVEMRTLGPIEYACEFEHWASLLRASFTNVYFLIVRGEWQWNLTNYKWLIRLLTWRWRSDSTR